MSKLEKVINGTRYSLHYFEKTWLEGAHWEILIGRNPNKKGSRGSRRKFKTEEAALKAWERL